MTHTERWLNFKIVHSYSFTSIVASIIDASRGSFAVWCFLHKTRTLLSIALSICGLKLKCQQIVRAHINRGNGSHVWLLILALPAAVGKKKTVSDRQCRCHLRWADGLAHYLPLVTGATVKALCALAIIPPTRPRALSRINVPSCLPRSPALLVHSSCWPLSSSLLSQSPGRWKCCRSNGADDLPAANGQALNLSTGIPFAWEVAPWWSHS